MKRPTIKNLAEAADVSIATVNRVLSGNGTVRDKLRQRVEAAAAEIGFYGLGAIQARNHEARHKYRFGVLLLQPHRPFYQLFAQAYRDAAAQFSDADVEMQIEFLEDLSPQNTADRALALAERCDALAVTASVHPILSDALATIEARGVPVIAVVSQLSATGQMPYVGLDNWKVGRTAAWAFDNLCKDRGKIGILIGNPRYRNQEMNEAGFRSYFREHATGFTLLEPLSTYESSSVATELTETLLREHSDLAGLYISGGGISGALSSVRQAGMSRKIVVVGYDLMDVTRRALLDGTMNLVIAHPLDRLARVAIQNMIAALDKPGTASRLNGIVPFEIYTPENL